MIWISIWLDMKFLGSHTLLVGILRSSHEHFFKDYLFGFLIRFIHRHQK